MVGRTSRKAWRDSMSAKDADVGTAVRAAVSVALASTTNTLLHPLHAARVILGLEDEETILQRIEEEEARILSARLARSLRTHP